jgi:hypothetical protein
LCFFFLLFEKKKMLGENTWNKRAEVGAKNERENRKLESKLLPLFAFFFFFMGFFFYVAFFFLLEEKTILKESAWNKSAKVRR